MLTASYKAEVEYRHRQFVADQETKANIDSFAAFLTSDTSKFGVMFCGTCGNGKTTLLFAFQSLLYYLVERGMIDSRFGISVVDAKDVQRQAKEIKLFQNLRSSEMLAIEDMGREATEILDYGNIINPVIDLLEWRYNEQLFTMITTNLTPSQIREKYGARIADRLNEMFENIIFKNSTYRR